MALTQISTAGVKDDAVTSGKIPANAVGSSELADNAVDTAAIANNAVTTAKLANQAVDYGKLADSAVIAAKLANNSVQTGKIADQAVTLDKLPHGTSSNDGKFLRANNGADPSFETVSIPAGTTINNNADNRVITGSDTANTLEGESGLTYDGADLNISNNTPQLLLTDTNSNNSYGRVRGNGGNLILSADHGNATAGSIINFEIDGSEQARITASGNVGIANNTPTSWGTGIPTVEFKGTGNTSRAGAIAFESQSGNNGYNVIYSDSGNLRIYGGSTNRASAAEKVMFPNSGGITFNGDTATANALDDYEEGTWTPTINVGTYTTFLTNRYIKIGRLVHLHGGLIFNNNTSSTRVEISNIPVSQQTGGQYVGNVWLRRTSTNHYNWNMILGEAGTNVLGIFRDSNGNDMGGHLSYNYFQHSSTYFNYSITYIAAS